ncbi:hypothetical protein CDAR_561001 [Caerostris darwini]|uniref:Uncharacterized protein n=1 Tax=Caerostris darwini TaxID=1538125 RepID=A0AAV4TFX2_9ARAC|nr:hypothetical protein CDAR_561001 [Caerostris darwini]
MSQELAYVLIPAAHTPLLEFLPSSGRLICLEPSGLYGNRSSKPSGLYANRSSKPSGLYANRSSKPSGLYAYSLVG